MHFHIRSTDDNQRADELLDYVIESDLELLNEGTEPTFITVNYVYS